MNNKQKELTSLSNKMVEVFIQNLFSKNNIDTNQVKLTDEQKESLKQSFFQLKEQVENYVNKHITEEDVDAGNVEEAISPLRERFLQRRAQKDNSDEEEK